MKTHDAVTIAQAAQSLDIGSRRLFKLLRRHGVLSDQNIASRQYVDAGYFRNEHRSHYLRGTHIQRWYTVPLVTGAGMAVIQELIDAEPVQKSEYPPGVESTSQTAKPVRSRRFHHSLEGQADRIDLPKAKTSIRTHR